MRGVNAMTCFMIGHRELPEGLELVPKCAAVVYANRYMVKNSDYLICYDPKRVGNTRDISADSKAATLNGMAA